MKKSVWKAIKRGDRIRRDLPRKRRLATTIRTIHSAMKDCGGGSVTPERMRKYLNASARNRA